MNTARRIRLCSRSQEQTIAVDRIYLLVGRCLLVVLLHGLASPALAGPQKGSAAPPAKLTKATTTLDRAETECASLDYENCAETAMLVVVAADATPAERTRARWIAGSAQRVIGKDVDAQMNFRALIQDSPNFVPPDDTPAKVMQFFALVKAEVVSERLANPAAVGDVGLSSGLVVESVPVGATVLIDGAAVGATPVRLADISVGLHEVTVTVGETGDSVLVPVEVFVSGPTTVRIAFRQPESREVADDADVGAVTAEDEEGLGWIGVVATKVGGCALSSVGGCCAGCLTFTGVLLTASVFGVSSSVYSNIAVASCSGIWLISGLMSAGLLGWAGYDLVQGLEDRPRVLMHVVHIIPPEGHGARREVRFPARGSVAY